MKDSLGSQRLWNFAYAFSSVVHILPIVTVGDFFLVRGQVVRSGKKDGTRREESVSGIRLSLFSVKGSRA